MRRLVVVLLALLVACDRGAEPPPPSYPADLVVLRIETVGGFSRRNHGPDLPRLVLYGDGRLVAHGPWESFPQPALAGLRISRVSPAEVRRLADAARHAGLDGETRDYGDSSTADAGWTRITLDDGRRAVTVTVEALDSREDPRLSEAQHAARRRLDAFVRGALAVEGTPHGVPYEPAAVAAYAEREHSLAKPTTVVPWPGADPGDGIPTRYGYCTVLAGNTLATLLPALRAARIQARWTYEGENWTIQLHPLLPGETRCPGTETAPPASQAA